ncbi:distal tail protein Dit [Anaerosolibacter sp.]|uniref:distal tail protein Dit n=1 Tax=Anaerosolibacter sp. TaxID=1872527 RepID=UPI0039EECC56
MMGLKFKDTHSSQYGLIVRSVDRNVLPPLKRREIEIPGKHGTYDFDGNVYEKRTISIEFGVVHYNFQDLRNKIRLIAAWLSGKGKLVFDDEPDKYYDAKIYQNVPLEQIISSGRFSVIFECQPFALSEDIENVATITSNNYNMIIENNGTIETPCIIELKNTGTSTITQITITKKVEV